MAQQQVWMLHWQTSDIPLIFIVFTIAAAFWARIEYQAKQSAPWNAMMKGPTTASRSVLLDYVSPWKPSALWAATKNKDYLVSIAIIGSFIFKLIIVFSTGLMSLARIEIHKGGINITTFNTFTSNLTALETVSSLPWDVLSGINYQNLSYPLGTNEQFVAQTFNATGVPEGSVVEATVDGFNAYLACEHADLVVDSWYLQVVRDPSLIDSSVLDDLKIVNPSCTVSNATIELVPGDNIDFNSTQSWALFRPVLCDGRNNTESRRVLLSAGNAVVGSKHTRYFVVNPNTTYQSNMSAETANLTVQHSFTLLCKPLYSMTKVIATANNTGTASLVQLQTVLAPGKNWTLEGISGWDIMDAQTAVAKGFVGTQMLEAPYPNVSINVDKQITQALRLYQDSRPSLSDLYSGGSLEAVANRYYAAITAQTVSKSLLKEEQAHMIGSAVVYENRVFVGFLATMVIETALTINIVLCIATLILIPKKALATRNPGSILGLATTLYGSAHFVSLLKRSGALDTSGLYGRIGGYMFHTANGTESKFEIYCASHEKKKNTPTEGREVLLPSWEPFTVKLGGRVFLGIFTVASIIALEICLHFSERHSGFGNAIAGGYLHYVWRYIPVNLMVLLGLLFTSLDFSMQCLAPYAKIRTYTSLSKSLTINYLDTLPAFAIVDTMKTGHWAVLLTLLAGLIASLLPIVAGGVFISTSVPLIWPMHLQQQSYFTSNESEVTTNTETFGMGIFGLVEHSNMSEPEWTHEELAITRLGLSLPDKAVINRNLTLGSASINVMAPALRSKLRCRVSHADTMNITLKFNSSVEDWLGNSLQNPLVITENSENCGSCPCTYFQEQTPFYLSAEPDTYFGMASDGVEPTCSNFTFMWGKLGQDSVQYVGYLGCNETAEMVNVNTTLLYPGLTFDTNHPPTPDESSATPYNAVIPPLEYTFGYLPNVTVGDNKLDTFWAAVVVGLGGIPIEYLSDPAHDQDVIDRVVHLHKMIRAQQFSNYTRIIPANLTKLGPPLLANITDLNRLRVVQDATSTRILEGLLVTMLLCAIFAAVLMDTRKVVPKNPCSIAAVASLLADSNLLEILSKNEEENDLTVDEKEIARRAGLLEKNVAFSMGWMRAGGMESEAVYGIQMVRLKGSPKSWSDESKRGIIISARDRSVSIDERDAEAQ